MSTRAIVRSAKVAFAMVLPLAAVWPASAAGTANRSVDLALVLAIDASGSITPMRWDLERQGYTAAFQNPDVVKAITSGSNGAIAVTLVEWSAQFEVMQIVPWTIISDATSADQFSADLAELPR